VGGGKASVELHFDGLRDGWQSPDFNYRLLSTFTFWCPFGAAYQNAVPNPKYFSTVAVPVFCGNHTFSVTSHLEGDADPIEAFPFGLFLSVYTSYVDGGFGESDWIITEKY